MKPLLLFFAVLLAACTTTPPAPPTPAAPPPKVRVGLALGGGAAKGFAHIGVIKMLEANGIRVDTVAGTSAGSVVGGLYASGMDAFALQEKAFGLDEAQIRDVSLLNGGIVKGQKLQDFVNQLVTNRPIDKFAKPFGAVATELDTGKRTVFVRGNAGQAIRASSSIPGVFEPALIAGKRYVDGGVVSPVPVDAARELGADLVIAVDISAKAGNKAPSGLIGTVNQAVVIMGQKLGEQELARADVVIRPKVGKIGPTDFDQKNQAILEGEKAALAAIPQIKQKIAEKQQALIVARSAAAQ
ncbi:patatin-like phospholipase family protein [Jeongeupia sp. USM3]|uniref:patatin-like phospholipase family protein n=1 Tax=Jeongeupia sp. USM3 TaxID=1906741 RepID=UPI0009F5FCBB|nr:patatin-like phospholipase family protein [Jeongeupia sp. USM3]